MFFEWALPIVDSASDQGPEYLWADAANGDSTHSLFYYLQSYDEDVLGIWPQGKFLEMIADPFLLLFWNPSNYGILVLEPAPTQVAEGQVQELFLGAPGPKADVLVFGLPSAQRVRLALYDAAGRRVALLADGIYEAGVHSVKLGALAGGVYTAMLETEDARLVQRFLRLR